MTREESRRITLKQFLAYMDEGEIVQVCFKSQEWADYTEFNRESPFLKPFLGCRIDCMGAEMTDNGNEPTIRVCVDDTNMVYLGE